MQVGRVRGSQRKVDNLVRQIEAMSDEVVAKRPDFQFDKPSVGWHRSKCVDVKDLGVVEGKYGPKHQVEFVWLLEERRESDGRSFLTWRRFTLSLADTSSLRRFLEVWQGYPFAPHELKAGVALASRYVGLEGLLLIEAREGTDGKVYRDVRAGYPLPAKAPRVKVDSYVRAVFRRKKGESSAGRADVAEGRGAGEAGGAPSDAGALGPDVAPSAVVPDSVSERTDHATGCGEAGDAAGRDAVGDGAAQQAPRDRTGALHEAFVRYRVAKGGRV